MYNIFVYVFYISFIHICTYSFPCCLWCRNRHRPQESLRSHPRRRAGAQSERCSVLQFVAVRCCMLQCAIVCCMCVAALVATHTFGLSVAVGCSVFQLVAVCCSWLQCFAVCCSSRRRAGMNVHAFACTSMHTQCTYTHKHTHSRARACPLSLPLPLSLSQKQGFNAKHSRAHIPTVNWSKRRRRRRRRRKCRMQWPE